MLIYISDERGLQNWLGIAQVQRKIRRVSRVGGFCPIQWRQRPKSRLVGALAHDRLRKRRQVGMSERTSTKSTGSLRRARSRCCDRRRCGCSVCRAGAFLTGSRLNWRATVAKTMASCRSRSPTSAIGTEIGIVISRGIRELCALGFVERARRAFRQCRASRAPKLFRLTYLPAGGEGADPTIGSDQNDRTGRNGRAARKAYGQKEKISQW